MKDLNKPKQVHPNDVSPHEFLRYVEELETYANKLEKQLRLYSVSSSKRFCKNDLLNAYQAGAVEMYNKIVNSIQKQTLKGLKQDSEEWLKLYDK